MPTPSLWRMAWGRPYSVAYNASRWATRSVCEPRPRGIADVLALPEGPPVTPLSSWGPVHLLVLCLPGMYLGSLFDGGAADLGGLIMEETARISSYGIGCGYNVFVGVTFGSASRVVISSQVPRLSLASRVPMPRTWVA
jgi:hypothetical protein